jgi:hypothetical protein
MEGAHAMRPFVAYSTPTLLIPIANPEFINAPLLKVPHASRGEPSRAPVRFPLQAGGTLRRGSSKSVVQ